MNNHLYLNQLMIFVKVKNSPAENEGESGKKASADNFFIYEMHL